MINSILKKGYSSFNLKEYDSLIYSEFEKLEISKNIFNKIRLDFKSPDVFDEVFSDILSNYQTQDITHRWDDECKLYQYQCRLEFDTFEDANVFKQQFLEKSTNYKINQLWFNNMYSSLDDNFIKLYEVLIKKILFDFYDIIDYTENQSQETLITYYNEGCFLEDHSDGPSNGRICAILLYLNTEYKKTDGGYLRLNSSDTEIIYPHFGNIVILDFTENDISHEVIECSNNGRIAILNFIKEKTNE